MNNEDLRTEDPFLGRNEKIGEKSVFLHNFFLQKNTFFKFFFQLNQKRVLSPQSSLLFNNYCMNNY